MRVRRAEELSQGKTPFHHTLPCLTKIEDISLERSLGMCWSFRPVYGEIRESLISGTTRSELRSTNQSMIGTIGRLCFDKPRKSAAISSCNSNVHHKRAFMSSTRAAALSSSSSSRPSRSSLCMSLKFGGSWAIGFDTAEFDAALLLTLKFGAGMT
jgi:hypothetical protein